MAIVSDRNQTMYSENNIFIVNKKKHNIVGWNDDKHRQMDKQTTCFLWIRLYICTF